MKRYLIVLAVIAGMVLLSACGSDSFVREEYAVDADGKTITTPDGKPIVRAREYSGGDANYTQYTRGIVDLQAAQKPIVSIKARAGETITLGGVESFEVYAPSGGGAGLALAPPAPKPTFMGEVRSTIRELTPWALAAGQYLSHKEDAETNRYIAGVNAARDTAFVNEFGASARAGYGVFRDIGVAQAANPGTHIEIGAGGMYAGRDGQNGDRAGRDLNGPGANTGTIAPVTIDASGPGAVVGDGNTTNNGTDNRSAVIDSPDQSGNCRETSCNPVTTPAPAPTPEG